MTSEHTTGNRAQSTAVLAEADGPFVQLIPDTDDAGAENQARYLVVELLKRNLEVEIVFFGQGRAHKRFEELGAPLRQIDRNRKLLFDWHSRVKVFREIYQHRSPALIHSWLMEANLVAALAARDFGKTTLVISQRSRVQEVPSAVLPVYRRVMRRADLGITNSFEGVAAAARLGIAEDRVDVIPNGISPDRIETTASVDEIKRELGLDAGQLLVVTAGRAQDDQALRHKDYPTLITAVELAREAKPGLMLVLVGPERADFERKGIQLPDFVQPIGWQSRPAEYLNAADVVALSSTTEGSSNTVGEALLLGRPVITTATGGHVKVVEESGGCVAPIGDSSAMAQALISMFENPPDRKRVAQVATQYLDINKMVDSTVAAYARAIQLHNNV